jgi:methionyl-tRNA formyltransferase
VTGNKLKIIFAGTPHFAARALEALLANHFEVIAVLTQPDRPAGRGMQLTPSPVKQLALQHDIPVLQPVSLKNMESQQQIAAFQADVMVVAAYGLILPAAVLTMPRMGCLNIHASLLPRWRGAAPIQRAILAGDTETGITIMQMDEGLDTGDMLLKTPCEISTQDTAQTLHDKLAKRGAETIVDVLKKLQQGSLSATAQDSSLATYAGKITKSEAQIDWSHSAAELSRAIRAYNPVPGSYSLLNGTIIKCWQASEVKAGIGEPGTVLAANAQGIQVACGQGALNLEILQRPNSKALLASQFIQGFPVKIGDRFANL